MSYEVLKFAFAFWLGWQANWAVIKFAKRRNWVTVNYDKIEADRFEKGF
jgi:hypothetical protein